MLFPVIMLVLRQLSYSPMKVTNMVMIPFKVIDKCFVGTASRLSGVTFEILAQEVMCTCSPDSDAQKTNVLSSR